MKPFKLEIINNNIYHLIFNKSEDLCKYLVRMEEFYESPEFKDKVFSLAEYIRWYSKEYGQWSYYTDWSGFNIPGGYVHEFKKQFKKLRSQEKQIIELLPDHKNFYLIATSLEKPSDVLDHEISHAAYYLDPLYKKEMDILV